jgi:dolichol kinase
MYISNVVFQALAAFSVLVAWQLVLARLSVDRDLKRNWQHWSTGQAFLLTSYVLPIQTCIITLLVSAALLYYLQFYNTDFFVKHFGSLLRSDEKVGKKPSGAFYFLLGTAATAYLVPIDTARFALQCLSTVDPVASFFGRNVRSARINKTSTVAGSIAGFVTASLIGFFYLKQASIYKIITGALACCIIEASPYGNDNFFIPVVTGLVVEHLVIL